MGAVLGIVALVLVAAGSARWFVLARAVQLPEDRSRFVFAWAGGAAMGAAALLAGPGWVGGVAAVLALGVGGVLTTLVGISAQKLGDDAISVGAKVPDFSAPDENGQSFSLSSLAGHPVLIKFFRGHW